MGRAGLFAIGGGVFMLVWASYDTFMFTNTEGCTVLSKQPSLDGPDFMTGWKIASESLRSVAEDARAQLEQGAQPGAANLVDRKQHSWMFSFITVSLPLASPTLEILVPPNRPISEGKGVVGLRVLNSSARKCLVYGLGIAGWSHFEQAMAESGCETHAFDCTIKPDSKGVRNKAFIFHEWCIGPESAKINEGNVFLKGGGLVFKTMAHTMRDLGHVHLDVLKFDIEGFEWDLFETLILPGLLLPDQLVFELHTEGAGAKWVSPEQVKGKGFEQVNGLFLRLFDLGYRVVWKATTQARFSNYINEFTLVRIHG